MTMNRAACAIALIMVSPLTLAFLPLVPTGFWLCLALLGGVGAIHLWGRVQGADEVQEIEDWVNMAETDRRAEGGY